MPKKLVFIHGRAQQHKDAAALKQEWIAAFREGLDLNKLPLPIPETDIRFPYYGDTLDQLTRGMDPVTAAKIIVKGTGPADAAERKFMQDVLKEVAAKAGITADQIEEEIPSDVVDKGALNWGWVQGILKAIDRRVPFGSSASVALFTKDAYQYLTNDVVSNAIDNGVLQAIHADEPTVVVSHSLGTVVAYRLVRREAQPRRWNITNFITVGSPLGVTKIRQTLAPISYPTVVGPWFNAFDERDVVALYPLQKPYFDVTPASITNKNDVKNGTENRHGISGYLNDPAVAKRIYDAIV